MREVVLSPRHKEILGLLCEGHRNSNIALLLGITEKTVKNHLTLMYIKAKRRGRVSLVSAVLRKEIVVR